jgi:hypothetical protein
MPSARWEVRYQGRAEDDSGRGWSPPQPVLFCTSSDAPCRSQAMVAKRRMETSLHACSGSRSVSTLLIAALGFAGCGESDHTWVTPGVGPLELHSTLPQSAALGTTLRLDGGAVVRVPPGVAPDGVTLGIREVEAEELAPYIARLSPTESPASAPYVLTPHGTQFKEPVEVSLPIAAGMRHELLQVSWLGDEADTTWKSLGLANVVGQDAVVRMSHFSVLMLTAIENECLTDNGGCDPLSACTPSVGGHACGGCPSGYSGDGNTGCTDLDECATNNGGCDSHVTCTNTAGGHTCGGCPSGYYGNGETGCADIDECATNNGGCDAHATCVNIPGGHSCSGCPAGYSGAGDTACVDIDECATGNGGCDPLTVCTNTPGSRTCSACPSGYSGAGDTGCTDVDECATNNGGCGDASLFMCQNNPGAPASCSCIEGAARLVGSSCGLNDAGTAWQTCASGDWQDRCFTFSDLGEGECRQGNADFPLAFDIGYSDLQPHWSGDNAEQTKLRCEQTCVRHADWCLAVELVLRDIWSEPECQLVTDRATFAGAGNSLQNDYWGGTQVIDGMIYQTYCGGGGNCLHTDWGGGSLYPESGYRCITMAEL